MSFENTEAALHSEDQPQSAEDQQRPWRRLLPPSPLPVSPGDLRAEEPLSLPGRFPVRRGNMGGTGSRRVSFGLDEDEKVTVIEGVKLSEDVLRWMKQPQGTDSDQRPPSPPDSHKPKQNPKPTGPSITEIHEELRKDFECQQALVQEQLARLAQRERETAAATGLDELLPTLIIEKGKAHEEREKAKMLARQLERKEKELASISVYYKEQLETLEKKNFDIYKESADQYNQAATKAEAHIRAR
ncbi:MICOS complex subunit mic25a-like isoform X2 [Limanda limanda]|uniref:MICOS complex subunit mic25a-like isoform X2 n=1 Tax=Limanda limanda TaxID=27771 RepID=UPI0029C88B25|nr:MICOS complex subunit mic25a-like isoform X2 [Limanda limanda]